MSLEKFTTQSYYELLGLKLDASKEDIKRAYRDISRIYDPSSNFYADLIQDPPKPRDIEIFKLVTQAYETLVDEDKRRSYDSSLNKDFASAAAYAKASIGSNQNETGTSAPIKTKPEHSKFFLGKMLLSFMRRLLSH